MAAAHPDRIDTEKQAFWIRTLQQWESSGESARAYCVRHGLKEAQFYWWKKVLQHRGKWRPRQSGKACRPWPESPSAPFAAVELRKALPAEISEPPESDRPAELELCVGGHYRVVIPAGFDPCTLEQVLSVLDGRGC
jgi:transposase-like protein